LKAGPPLLQSAVDLSPEQRTAIQKGLNEAFSADIPLSFKAAPELGGGIELLAHGQKLAWTIGDYLGSLEGDVGRLLDSGAPAGVPGAKLDPVPAAKP
jgi:F-type H+-transporting ATPase subunit b